MQSTRSIRDVPIRLPDERWIHIVENHDDLAGAMHYVLDTVANPDFVLKDKHGAFLAVRSDQRRCLVVLYREVTKNDGFIITAFQTSKQAHLFIGRKILWKKRQFKKR